MLEAFRQASLKAKLTNIFLIIFDFLAWVACCVAFGGVLFTGKWNGTEFDAYYNKVKFGGQTYTWDEVDDVAHFGHTCTGAGRGLVAMSVFAWLGLSGIIIIHLIRVLGIKAPRLSSARECLFIELILMITNIFFLFLGTVIFGGGCVHECAKQDGVSWTGTGYGFYIAVFLFQCIFAFPLLFIIRGDSSLQFGSDSSSESYISQPDPSSGAYQPPAPYQYQSNAPYQTTYGGDMEQGNAGAAL